nr:MAG TPA: hypothetical protein [Caudoviricetes sp.]
MSTVNRPWYNLVAAKPASKGIRLKPLGYMLNGVPVLNGIPAIYNANKSRN